MIELERQTTDHNRPLTKALYISGNFGSGRRTLAQRFYEQQYPHVGSIFPTIRIAELFGVEEIHREVFISLRPNISLSELKTRATSFAIADDREKFSQISQIINSLLPAPEAAFLLDTGGALTDSGEFGPELNGIIGCLEAKPHPPLAIISHRMVPRKLRRKENDMAYVAVNSLKREASERLLSRLLKDCGIRPGKDQFNELVALTDGHPYNFYRLIDELKDRGVEAFLANPSSFIEWKHRLSSEYLSRVSLSTDESMTLGLLKLLPELDFAAIVSALPIDPAIISDALSRLSSFHIVESINERFRISPALRVAVERDKRILLNGQVHAAAVRAVAENLTVRLEEGTAAISLIDSAVLTSIESATHMSSYIAAFLLPSHYVWLCKLYYDSEEYKESIRLANEALKNGSRLSTKALVTCCRYKCLAASRIGQASTFLEGIKRLEASAIDDWARSNVSYLKGFNHRMKEQLPSAEDYFREAYRLSPGNSSAAREIAAICLARNKLEEAEIFAREAYNGARSNAYFLDILLAVLIRRYGRSASHTAEIMELFDALVEVGEEQGRSFFTTRKAEFEHLWGDNNEALRLITLAVNKTPNLFEPKRLQAKIFLKSGLSIKAFGVIESMRAQVEARSTSDRRANYRLYIETMAEYLVCIGKYDDAKELYADQSIFTADEGQAARREIEITQAYRSKP